MPVLKLSYNEIISEAKIWILKAVDSAKVIKSLDQLEQASEYKTLLGYIYKNVKILKV